eukprot:Gb_29866 [translate_table: standard]
MVACRSRTCHVRKGHGDCGWLQQNVPKEKRVEGVRPVPVWCATTGVVKVVEAGAPRDAPHYDKTWCRRGAKIKKMQRRPKSNENLKY